MEGTGPFNGMVWVGGGWAFVGNYYGNQQRATTMPNPRVVPVTLRTEDRATTKLSVLEGTVIAEAILKDVEVQNIENIKVMLNTSLQAGIGTRISIVSYELNKDGTTKLKIRKENSPTNRKRGGMAMVNMGFAVEVGGRSGNQLANITFLKADGKATSTPKTGQIQNVESMNGYAQEFDVTFAKDSQPVQMKIKGDKSVTLTVPFKMTNVSLP
jgi:hypothetical protein